VPVQAREHQEEEQGQLARNPTQARDVSRNKLRGLPESGDASYFALSTLTGRTHPNTTKHLLPFTYANVFKTTLLMYQLTLHSEQYSRPSPRPFLVST
jgi:hypothetical protein